MNEIKKTDLELLETLVKVSNVVDKSLVVNLDTENKVVRFNHNDDLVTMEFKHVTEVFIHKTTKQYVVRTESEVARCKRTNIEFRYNWLNSVEQFDVHFDRPEDVLLWIKSIPLYSEFIHEMGFPVYEEVSEKEYMRGKSTAELFMTRRNIDPLIGCYKLSKFNFSKRVRSVYRTQMYTFTENGPKEVDVYYDRLQQRLRLKNDSKDLVKRSPDEMLTKYVGLLDLLYSTKNLFRFSIEESNGVVFIQLHHQNYSMEFPLPCSRDKVDYDVLKEISERSRDFVEYVYTDVLNRIWDVFVRSFNDRRIRDDSFRSYAISLDTRSDYRWEDTLNGHAYRIKIRESKSHTNFVITAYVDYTKGLINLDIKRNESIVFERKYIQTSDFEKTMRKLLDILPIHTNKEEH